MAAGAVLLMSLAALIVAMCLLVERGPALLDELRHGWNGLMEL